MSERSRWPSPCYFFWLCERWQHRLCGTGIYLFILPLFRHYWFNVEFTVFSVSVFEWIVKFVWVQMSWGIVLQDIILPNVLTLWKHFLYQQVYTAQDRIVNIWGKLIWYSLMKDSMGFSRAFCYDLIIKGETAARDACAEISQVFGLVVMTVNSASCWVKKFSRWQFDMFFVIFPRKEAITFYANFS